MKGDEEMKKNKQVITVIIPMFFIICIFTCGAALADNAGATVQVSPASVAVDKAIFKTPIVFHGSGWKPGEVVSVEMVIPPGLKIPAVDPGEDAGIAVGKVDEKGDFKCKMGGMTKVITLFRGTIDPVLFKPIPETLKPIPPGKYTFKASGMTSGSEATTSIEFLKPEPKPKK